MLTQINDDTWFDLAEVAGVSRVKLYPDPGWPGSAAREDPITQPPPPILEYRVITKAGKVFAIDRPFMATVMRILGNPMDASLPPGCADYAQQA